MSPVVDSLDFGDVRVSGMRRGITVDVTAADRARLEAIAADRNSPQKLSKRRLKRGVLKSIVDLQAAINRFLGDHNLNPKPFVWTKDPEEIIAAVKRGHQVLDSIH